MASILIFTDNLLETFAHYQKAFNAKIIGEGYSDYNELIHLEMDILGSIIALAPRAPHEIRKGNVVAICLKFSREEDLIRAYDT